MSTLSDNSPLPQRVPSSTRRRVLLVLLALGLAASGVWYWCSRQLNAVELQLVGRWEGTHFQEGVPIAKMWLELRADRSASVELATVPVAGKPIKPIRIRMHQPKWRVRHHQLKFLEGIGFWQRSEVELRRLWGGWGFGAWTDLQYGPVSDVGPDSFQVGTFHVVRLKASSPAE